MRQGARSDTNQSTQTKNHVITWLSLGMNLSRLFTIHRYAISRLHVYLLIYFDLLRTMLQHMIHLSFLSQNVGWTGNNLAHFTRNIHLDCLNFLETFFFRVYLIEFSGANESLTYTADGICDKHKMVYRQRRYDLNYK